MSCRKTGDPPPDSHDSSSNAWQPLSPQPRGKPAHQKSAPRQYGNFAHSEGGFGPEISFARHLLKTNPERKIAILKVAFSGTSIPQDWDPAKKESDVSQEETKDSVEGMEEAFPGDSSSQPLS